MSAYLDGLAFAAHLFAQDGWTRIDHAYAAPPESTEQVLHPERSARELRPDHLRLPAPEAALGPGFELAYEDTLGELELSVYFGQGSPVVDARRAAAGWGGDRLYLYSSANAEAVALWLTSWDSERDAEEAEQAAQRVRAKAGATANRQLVRRLGRRVVIVRNADAETQARLLARFGVATQD
jgi:hypothetical protein